MLITLVGMIFQLLITSVAIVVIGVPLWVLVYYFFLDFLPVWLSGIIGKGIVQGYTLLRHIDNGGLSKTELQPYALTLLLSSVVVTVLRFPDHGLETVFGGAILGVGLFSIVGHRS